MIQVKNLTKYYGEFLAIDHLSFSIEKNNVVALLGKNGAGKTTTLRILTGFLPPSSGDIYINGLYSFKNHEFKKQIGYLPERPAFYPDLTIEAFLKYMYRLRLYSKESEKEAIDKSLEKTNLLNRRKDLIGTLSAGYKKRVGLAQAIIHNPPVLIFDEPIADLDPIQIVEVRNLILELKKEHTILISSHILSEVSQIADKFIFIDKGKSIAEENSSNLRKKMETSFHYLLQLRISEEEKSECIKKLNTIDGITKVSEIKSPKDYSFEIHATKDIRSQLAKRVIEWGYDLLQIQEKKVSLEEIFMQLTK